jgi:hypothetical protein
VRRIKRPSGEIKAMSSVIEFLERLGADALLRHATQEEIAVALETSQVEAEIGAAIIARSTSDLYALLDQQQPMFHVQNNPGREEEEEEEEGEDDEEAPSQRKLAGLPPARRTTVALG